MGVYIKGMEMPTCCAGCIVACDAKSRTGFIRPFAERLPDCPLVPVPPHGRLIDADARVNVQIYNDEFEDFQTVNMSIDDLLDSSWIEIEDDPTIIPASGGKEDE